MYLGGSRTVPASLRDDSQLQAEQNKNLRKINETICKLKELTEVKDNEIIKALEEIDIQLNLDDAAINVNLNQLEQLVTDLSNQLKTPNTNHVIVDNSISVTTTPLETLLQELMDQLKEIDTNHTVVDNIAEGSTPIVESIESLQGSNTSENVDISNKLTTLVNSQTNKIAGYQPLDCDNNPVGLPIDVLPTVVLNTSLTNVCNSQDIYQPIVDAISNMSKAILYKENLSNQINGSNLVFVTSEPITTVFNLYYNGQLLVEGLNYSFVNSSVTTITLSLAFPPSLGETLIVEYLK